MNERKISQGKRKINELANILEKLSDTEVGKLFDTNEIDRLLRAILDPSKVKEYANIAEYLLDNKHRVTILALIRQEITQNYSFKATKNGKEAYVSPDFHQWFEDGVMFLEGKERFAGFIGLYSNGELKYAIAARDARKGEQLGPDHFQFLKIEDFKERAKAIPPNQITDLERPIRELKELIETHENSEARYQELIEKYPWVLGVQYSVIQRHTKFDDKNIPDFTGFRVRDGYRDIFELKPPFMKVCREDGNFTSDFNEAWNQAERYLDFAREEKDYLRRKGMLFDNPKCYLVLGWNLSDEEIKKIRTKERTTPSIEFLTYNDLIDFMSNTIEFVQKLGHEGLSAGEA